jgi:UDP-N-acetyl-D-mannosaminouronate:lipid I N-acetyl-D-mannosaminouronosyltransferase
MTTLNPTTICGLKLYPFQCADEIAMYVEDKKTILIAIGAEKLLNEDQKFKDIVNRNTAYCDGIGAVWALRRKGVYARKIPGALLWLDLVRHFRYTKIFYLIGAARDILDATVEKLRVDYSLNLCGYQHGYYSAEEYEALKRDLVEKRPDVVFVALGSPKQEFVMDELFRIHPALYMGLGGSFDLYAGKVKPVPTWWIRIFKWEGLYRQVYDLRDVKRWRRQFSVLAGLWRLIQ